MTNTAYRKTVRMVMTFICVLAASAILFRIAGLSAEEKVVPDHGSLTDCMMCHSETYKMWKSTGHSNSAACTACHKPGSGAYPKQLVRDPEKICDECHSQRTVIQGKGAKGIEDMRSPHSGVTCVSCHMARANHDLKLVLPNDPDLPEDVVDTCVGCHKDNSRKIRSKQLTDWHRFYQRAMDPIEADMAEISAALKAKPDALNPDLKARLDTVAFNLAILTNDGSRGAHNLDFTLEVMSMAAKDIKAIKAALSGGQ